jgi:hypothetical protein
MGVSGIVDSIIGGVGLAGKQNITNLSRLHVRPVTEYHLAVHTLDMVQLPFCM